MGLLVVPAALVLAALVPAACGAPDGQVCYTSGGVAGIVIATVVVTVVMGGLAAAAVWYLWKQRPVLSGEGKKKPGSTFFTSAMEKNCTNIDPKLSEKVRPAEGSGKEAYAFDNPYFKDDETDGKPKNQDAAEKGEAGFKTDNGNIRTVNENKVNAAPKPKKNRPFSNLQFPNVFHQGFKKPRAMDDTFIPKALERVEVPLRGHDFTGLGFNICGNMRDGIFVKDVLHRGPASESGKIKAGDRIVGVWVSFSGMVYEDALTILSYASPYDVRLELEKTVDAGKLLALPASSPASKTRQLSSSFRTGQRLFHPLYRSQSFDDLTQIGKDSHLPLNNNNASAISTNPNSCNSCPKRSQSIEGATSPKPRIQQGHVVKPSRKPSTSSSSSTKKPSPSTPKASKVEPDQPAKNPSPKLAPSAEEKPVSEKKVEETSVLPPTDISVVSTDESRLSELDTTQVTVEESSKLEEASSAVEDDKDRPTAPPRKIPGHAKRKAPAPPKEPQDLSKTKTSAIVHRDAEDDTVDSRQEDVAGDAGSDESAKIGDVHSLSGDSPSQPAPEETDPNSSPKRKACSLGDLTKLDSGRQKKSPATATILERAVSLDLQQSLPEGNLVKQKMILKAPTFEHPEDSSEEDLLPKAEEKKPSAGLARWDGNWSKLQEEESSTAVSESSRQGLWPSAVDVEISSKITNGHPDQGDGSDDQGSYLAFESPFVKTSVDEQVTSTPARNCIASEFFKNSVDIDDIPYLGDSTLNCTAETSESTVHSRAADPAPPISLSIPVIKPNFSQYEMLPSPGKGPSAQPSPAVPSDDQRHGALGQDISSIESSYKPVFSSNSFRDSSAAQSDDASSTTLSALDIVNGNGEVSSSSYAQYRTALDDPSATDTCILESKATKEVKNHSLTEVSGIKVHGGAAGFAKTLIICTPIEGESISLNADLDTPPPALEPPL